MSDSFTGWLRANSEPDWTAVTTHPFTTALFDGTVTDSQMRSYLVQDYQFVDQFLALLGAALAKADRYQSRLAIGPAIAVITSDENTYFSRAFDALGVPEQDQIDPPLDGVTVAFRDLMAEVSAIGSYPEVLTVLAVAEWSYLEWALRAPNKLPENFLHAEWITLHNSTSFGEWVSWLLSDLDRVGTDLQQRDRDRCLAWFRQATALEKQFFDTHLSGHV